MRRAAAPAVLYFRPALLPIPFVAAFERAGWLHDSRLAGTLVVKRQFSLSGSWADRERIVMRGCEALRRKHMYICTAGTH